MSLRISYLNSEISPAQLFEKSTSSPGGIRTAPNMIFTITAATAIAPTPYNDTSDSSSVDSEGDTDMARPAKRPKLSTKSIVTPGETVTDDPQWMRCSIAPILFSFSNTC